MIPHTHPHGSQASTPLQTASLANLGGSRHKLIIPVRVSRPLDTLAKRANSHGLPALDALHLGEELARRASRVHVTLDILINRGALLEEADAVVVRADAVVRQFQGFRNSTVGVHDEAGLYSTKEQSAREPISTNVFGALVGTARGVPR